MEWVDERLFDESDAVDTPLIEGLTLLTAHRDGRMARKPPAAHYIAPHIKIIVNRIAHCHNVLGQPGEPLQPWKVQMATHVPTAERKRNIYFMEGVWL